MEDAAAVKRFWKAVDVVPAGGGWRVRLDGRGIRTAGGRDQVLPSAALADALAAEWRSQGPEIDPAGFMLRDLTDYAIDVVAAGSEALIAELLPYAETDTLCYRGEPGEALTRRQEALWEPLLTAAERRYDVHFERASGILHRPQPPETLARLRSVLAAQDAFTLAALFTLTSLAASLVIALAALEADADAKVLWDAAELEADWQAELWGADAEAEARRAGRLAAFVAAMRFARLASA